MRRAEEEREDSGPQRSRGRRAQVRYALIPSPDRRPDPPSTCNTCSRTPRDFGRREAIRAVIDYSVNPWTEPSLASASDPQREHGISPDEASAFGDARAILRGSIADIGYPVRPTDAPRFWHEVRQLSFAFAGNDWPTVRAFYRSYGPLGDAHQSGVEPWAWAAAAAQWFQKLTVMLEAIEKGRIGQIEEFEGISPKWRGSPFALHPPGGLIIPPCRFDEDATEEERYAAAWVRVIEAVTAELSKIPLAPIRADLRDIKTPAIAWGFSPAGAFHAGFLQWYFEKLAHVDLPVCAAPDCDNLVPPGRSKWCSERCREREKKRKQVERRGRVGKRTGPRRARDHEGTVDKNG